MGAGSVRISNRYRRKVLPVKPAFSLLFLTTTPPPLAHRSPRPEPIDPKDHVPSLWPVAIETSPWYLPTSRSSDGQRLAPQRSRPKGTRPFQAKGKGSVVKHVFACSFFSGCVAMFFRPTQLLMVLARQGPRVVFTRRFDQRLQLEDVNSARESKKNRRNVAGYRQRESYYESTIGS